MVLRYYFDNLMVFLWYSCDISRYSCVCLWCYCDILVIFSWYFRDMLVIFLRCSSGILAIFLWYSCDVTVVFFWYSVGILVILLWYYSGILTVFLWYIWSRYSCGILAIYLWYSMVFYTFLNRAGIIFVGSAVLASFDVVEYTGIFLPPVRENISSWLELLTHAYGACRIGKVHICLAYHVRSFYFVPQSTDGNMCVLILAASTMSYPSWPARCRRAFNNTSKFSGIATPVKC